LAGLTFEGNTSIMTAKIHRFLLVDFWAGCPFWLKMYREFRQTLAKMVRAIELETSKPILLSLEEKKKVQHSIKVQ
jgi:hypothetical protein